MDASALLSSLTDLQEKNEKHADKYLEVIQEFLAKTPETHWNSRHDQVFKLMQNRVKAARIYSMLLFGFTILVLLAVGSFIFIRMKSSADAEANTALVDLARSATLPLQLVENDQNGEFLNIQVHNYFEDLNSEDRGKVQKLINKFPNLGRTYNLGTSKKLNAAIKAAQRDGVEASLFVTPSPEGATLGQLELVSSLGKIWPSTGVDAVDARQSFPLSQPIEFEQGPSGMGFFARVIRFDETRKKWVVQFREQDKQWSKEFYIAKSNYGVMSEPTFVVYQDSWNSIYSITMGIGNYGKNEDGTQFAWYVRSFARKLSF